LFRKIGDIAFNAQKLLCLGFVDHIEHEWLIFHFGFPDKLGSSDKLITIKKVMGFFYLLVELSLVFFVSCFGELTDHEGVLDNSGKAKAP
jgi:hypothetical protein